VADIAIETYDAGAVGDHLYLVSGGDLGDSPAVIWSARPHSGVSDGGGYGDNCLARCDDLDGDAFPDLLLGTAWGNRSVHALSGRDGSLIWTFDTYTENESGWVYSVAPHPDRTMDGVPEVICGAGSDNNMGYLLDGASGAVIWRFAATDAVLMALSLPDVNGDAVADVLFCGGDNDHFVYCVSGAGSGSPALIWSRNTGDSNQAATLIDDIDGDDIPEVVIGNWDNVDQVQCLSGASGQPRWFFDNGASGLIMRLVTAGDLDGDGVGDVAVGSWENAIRTVSGQDGSLIWESWAGSLNGGDFWAVDRVDDLTGDGKDEVIGGSFDNKVYLFDGADGDTLWMFNTGRRLYTVRGSADLTGNGMPDLLAGTQNLTGQPGGLAFALGGSDDLTAANDLWAAGAASADPAAQGASLRWTCNQALPFNLYRAVEDGSASADRMALLQARDRGELRVHEVLEAVRGQAETPFIRLNAEPVMPAAGAGAAWRYAFADAQLPAPAAAGRRVLYRLAALLPEGGEQILLELELSPAPAGEPALLRAAALAPNPFNPSTTIQVELAAPAGVGLLVHDGRGRRVSAVPPRPCAAGLNVIAWQAQDLAGRPLPAGVYLVTPMVDGRPSPALRAVLLK
jgi:hypothetical protein